MGAVTEVPRWLPWVAFPNDSCIQGMEFLGCTLESVTQQLPNAAVVPGSVPVPPLVTMPSAKAEQGAQEGTHLVLFLLYFTTPRFHQAGPRSALRCRATVLPSHAVGTGSAQSDLFGSCSSREGLGLS